MEDITMKKKISSVFIAIFALYAMSTIVFASDLELLNNSLQMMDEAGTNEIERANIKEMLMLPDDELMALYAPFAEIIVLLSYEYDIKMSPHDITCDVGRFIIALNVATRSLECFEQAFRESLCKSLERSTVEMTPYNVGIEPFVWGLNAIHLEVYFASSHDVSISLTNVFGFAVNSVIVTARLNTEFAVVWHPWHVGNILGFQSRGYLFSVQHRLFSAQFEIGGRHSTMQPFSAISSVMLNPNF
jgi:hypothetical protein